MTDEGTPDSGVYRLATAAAVAAHRAQWGMEPDVGGRQLLAEIAAAVVRVVTPTGGPAARRVLESSGWTNADVTAAVGNLLGDGDEVAVRQLLQALAGYRPGRGPGRRRAAGGTR